jgi:hypothetical protein
MSNVSVSFLSKKINKDECNNEEYFSVERQFKRNNKKIIVTLPAKLQTDFVIRLQQDRLKQTKVLRAFIESYVAQKDDRIVDFADNLRRKNNRKKTYKNKNIKKIEPLFFSKENQILKNIHEEKKYLENKFSEEEVDNIFDFIEEGFSDL